MRCLHSNKTITVAVTTRPEVLVGAVWSHSPRDLQIVLAITVREFIHACDFNSHDRHSTNVSEDDDQTCRELAHTGIWQRSTPQQLELVRRRSYTTTRTNRPSGHSSSVSCIIKAELDVLLSMQLASTTFLAPPQNKSRCLARTSLSQHPMA